MNPKILIAGNWRAEIHEASLERGFNFLGCEVFRFSFLEVFPESIFGKIQRKLSFGPHINLLNRRFVEKCRNTRPNIIFIYRNLFISRESLLEVRAAIPKVKIFYYNNDDAFSNLYPFMYWQRHKTCVPVCDVIFAYRKKNICEYNAIGARRCELLPPWFLQKNIRVPRKKEFSCDILFAGHYEHDGRLAFVKRLAQTQYSFRLFGPEWNKIVSSEPELRHLYPVSYLSGDDYIDSLNSARVCLSFFSHLNNDQYTRRCFEIPAAGSVLAAPETQGLNDFVQAGLEYLPFSNVDDLIRALTSILDNNKKRYEIAKNGNKRIIDGENSEYDRAKFILKFYEE